MFGLSSVSFLQVALSARLCYRHRPLIFLGGFELFPKRNKGLQKSASEVYY